MESAPFSVTLSLLPLSFWVALSLLGIGTLWAWGHLRDGMGVPVMVVMGTIAAWYVGDAFYNNYSLYADVFGYEVRDDAWWEVAIFVISFLWFTPLVHRWINRRELRNPSQLTFLLRKGGNQPQLQAGLEPLLWGCIAVWGVLSLVAFYRLQGDIIHYFCPYLDYRAEPWARGQIGAGLDFLWSVAYYFQLFVAATFGVIMVLVKRLRCRILALVGVLLTWPYFLFDRTRNVMLAAVLPAVLSLAFVRLRSHLVIRIAVLVVSFLLINAWFAFVLTNRGEDVTNTTALKENGFDPGNQKSVHHLGLNMFEELCWINAFIDLGRYQPDWGDGYFSEFVNPIPRSIWPNKPLIGFDYNILRGQVWIPGDPGMPTLSSGIVGQGVLNFGKLLGPVAAAFLTSIWVAVLIRLDLTGQKLGRLPLYGLGLILTFNLGRDITLITLYTFVFGAGLVWLLELRTKKSARRARNGSSSKRGRKLPAPSAIPDETVINPNFSRGSNPASLPAPSARPGWYSGS